MAKQTYPVIIREGEDGFFIAECPTIEGCLSQGRTIAEAVENIQEAILLCLEEMRDRGEPWPEPSSLFLSEVAVAI